MPLPENVRPFKDSCDTGTEDVIQGEDDEEEECRSLNDDDDIPMDSSASSSNVSRGQQQPTSNLIAPDSLKKRQPHVVHVVTEASEGNNQELKEVTIDDYIKDTKTLNVNVLAADATASQMNNKLNFDSDKFSRHHENTRPQETIDNLSSDGTNPGLDMKKSPQSKKCKATNLFNDGGEYSLDFKGIKRMRLDSHEKVWLTE